MTPPAFDIQTPIQDVYAAYPDCLAGRALIVTGATAGLGLAFSRFVANHGAGTVIISGRSEEKLKRALAEIEKVAEGSSSDSKPTVKSLIMDLTDYDSVKRAAAEVNALGIKIDILLNNAGIMGVPYKKINGYESQFVANHLGHFLFTNLIFDSLEHGARVINATSLGYMYSPVRFDDINFQMVRYIINGYGQSKTANILFTKEITKKYKSKGIESFSVHPGSIVETSLADHLDPKAEGFQNADGAWNVPVIVHNELSIAQGIATYLFAAISPELEGKGGAFLTESQVTEDKGVFPDEDATRLWDLSNEILGTSF